jgi:hypothetical protein
MKRKLLPYGMPLGGAGSALGAMSQSTPTNSAAPAGGKSSGLGQGGYGAAPAFQGQMTGGPGMGPSGFQQTTAQTQPPGFGLGAGTISSVNTTTQQDMMGGNRNSGQDFGQALQSLGMMRGTGSGKSSGAGQGGYGGAPGFGSQQPQVQQPLVQQPQGRSGTLSPEMQDYYARDAAAQAERAQRMQSGFGQAIGNIAGNSGFPDPRIRNQQQQQFNQPQQPTPESLYAANMGMQQPQRFNQQRFNPFQQQFGGFQQPNQQFGQFQQQQQQDMRGLAELLSLLRGRQG